MLLHKAWREEREEKEVLAAKSDHTMEQSRTIDTETLAFVRTQPARRKKVKK